jgi:hypothetical protein
MPSYVMSCEEHQSRVRQRASPLPPAARSGAGPLSAGHHDQRYARSAVDLVLAGQDGLDLRGRCEHGGTLAGRVVLPGWPAFTEAGAMVTI